MATPNYEIDYNDKRFTDVKAAEKTAINNNNTFYNDAVNKIDNQINTQIGNVKDWGAEQAKNQQAQSDFAIKQIEQKKAQAQEDYKKEQSGAYVDWQKQSNPYGANAEQMAAQGMSNTGYSESSKVNMYVSYQNRVAVAREAISRAELEFDNQMTQARLQNSSILAEIAYNTLKEIDSLTLAGIQQTTALRSEQAKRETELKQIYHNQWQDVLKQINTENSLAESVRQYNETMAFNKQKEANDKAYQEAALALEREKFSWQKAQAASSGGGSTIKKSSGGSSKKSSSSSKKSSSGSSKSISKPKYSVSGALQKMSGSGKSNAPKVDMNSVIKQGYGPISAKTLADKVNKGILVPEVKNGKTTFKKVLSSGAGKKTWLTTHFK